MLWSEADAKKKRHIIRAKKKAWEEFASHLDNRKDKNFLWAFAKKTNFAKDQINGVATGSFRLPSGEIASIPLDKSRAFLDNFDLSSQLQQSQDLNIEMEIDEAIEITTAHPLNCDISHTELNAFISRRKSNAIGLDLIQSDMLLHLSPENRQVLFYVFN